MLNKILDFLFPIRCYHCHTIVENEGLCNKCWSKITFNAGASCIKCSYPFELETRNDLLCGYCLQKKNYFDKLYFVAKYDSLIKDMIYKFKYNDKIIYYKLFSLWLKNLVDKKEIKFEFIAPIPMHKKKLRSRKFNQSCIIANELSKKLSTPIIRDLLIKKRYDKSQTELTAKQRQNNIKGSIIINPKYKTIIKDKNILLVDDVFTTGATINECCKILKKNHINRVTAITIARTII